MSTVKPAAVLLVLPALFLSVELMLRGHALPYWLWYNLDPSYLYLINGMYVLEGVPPGHVDHPGTPVQALAALVVWASGAGSPGGIGDLAFARAEELLTRISTVILVADAGGLFVLGWTAWRRLGALTPALFAEATPFFTMLALKHGVEVKPEPLLLLGVALLGAAMMAEATRPTRWSFAALGIVVGFGTACKITFAPLGVAPLFLMRDGRRRWPYVGFALVWFIVFIAPALGALPQMVGWLSREAIGSGVYGAGPPTIIDPYRFPANFVKLFFARPIFLIFYVLSLAALVVRWRERRAQAASASPPERALAGILAAQFAQMLLIAKQPSAHYVLPALELSGPAASFLWVVAGEIDGFGARRMLVARAWTALFVVIGALQLVAIVRQDRELASERRGSLSIDLVRDFPRCAHVYRNLASAPSLAWFYSLTYHSQRYLARVAPLMPTNDYFSLSWEKGGDIQAWHGAVTAADLARDYPCVTLRGTNLDELKGLGRSFGALFERADVCRAGSEFVLAAGASRPNR